MTGTELAIVIPTVFAALGAATSSIIGAINAGRIAVIKAQSDAANVKADVANAKMDALSVKTQEIHETTDGHLSKVSNTLESATKEIERLRSVISEDKMLKMVNVAVSAAAPPAPAPAPPSSVIADNTAATLENTKATLAATPPAAT
jgi:hypothetical protein